MEKAREHNVPIHFNFIDVKAAFDTVWREALWRMLEVVGVGGKVLNIIRHGDTECAVVVDGCTSEWFRVGIGVRQGCLLSPALFNVFLEFVMEELGTLDGTLTYNAEMAMDILYADDTTLLSAVFRKLEIVTEELEVACRRWGMKMNVAKCKVLLGEARQMIIDNTSSGSGGQVCVSGYCGAGRTPPNSHRISLPLPSPPTYISTPPYNN